MNMHKLLGLKKTLFAVVLAATALAVAACTGSTSGPPPLQTATPEQILTVPDSFDGASSLRQVIVSTPGPAANELVVNESPALAASGGDAVLSESEGLDASAPAPTAADVFAAQEALLVDLYDRVAPSVVRIVTAPGTFGAGEGSGFVWDDSGHIVTNYHVVRAAEDEVRVIFFNGDEYDASIVGNDPAADLAVIKIDAPSGDLVPVVVGDSSELRPGQFAMAFGSPFGQDFSMTTGIVSAVGRLVDSGFSQFAIPEVVQTDAAINPGNSGGPLLDRHGRVIGINTQIRSSSGQNSGVGFAVSINLAKRVVPAIIEEGEHHHSWLGISARDLDKDLRDGADLESHLRGTLVQVVVPDSPAARAGLRGGDKEVTVLGRPVMVGGDIITSIQDSPVQGIEDVIAYLALNTSPGDRVTLGVLRGGKQTDVVVELGERPVTPAS